MLAWWLLLVAFPDEALLNVPDPRTQPLRSRARDGIRSGGKREGGDLGMIRALALAFLAPPPSIVPAGDVGHSGFGTGASIFRYRVRGATERETGHLPLGLAGGKARGSCPTGILGFGQLTSVEENN